MERIQRILLNGLLALVSSVIGFLILEAGARAYISYWSDEDTFLRYASVSQLKARPGTNVPRYSFHRI